MDGHNQAVWLIYVRKDFEVLQLWIFYQIKRLQVLFAEVLITQNTQIWKYTKERAESSKITLTSFAGKETFIHSICTIPKLSSSQQEFHQVVSPVRRHIAQ